MMQEIPNIRDSLNALKQVMGKNTNRSIGDVNLVQCIEYQLNELPESCIKVQKDSFDLLMPLNTMSGNFDLLINVAVRKRKGEW